MSTPEVTSQAPEGDAQLGRRRARWKKVRLWLGALLTTAVVTPLLTWGVTSGMHWIDNIMHPPQYLSAEVVIPSPAAADGGEGWVFAKPPTELPLPPEHGDVDRWAKANDGIPASGNVIVVTLQGLNGHNVVVQDISVEIVSRTDPPQGTHVMPPRQKGLMPMYGFGLNLDASPIAVTAQADQRLPHLITNSGPEALRIAAVTTTCTCEWTATLHWSADDGKQGTKKVDYKGRPFRVAATTHATTEMLG